MLTSKQRSYLKALANGIEPIFQVGKGGITDVMAKEIRLALDARELIKITVLRNSDYDARLAVQELAEATGAEPVCAIGSKCILYKRNRKEPKIILPR
ncbi:MAG: YhbY family RNA-binding protein [Clostridia bacterium]|nr:YhbY family RNA-binding protein [Clostridia bacterium]MBO7156843.1 YhbY family RNA-binding protein [Clostridia bacterium]